MLHKFDTKYATYVYAILGNPNLNDDERSKLIGDLMEEFNSHYPDLNNTATKSDLSETELKLIKEIKEIETNAQQDRDKIRLEMQNIETNSSKEIKEIETNAQQDRDKIRLEIKNVEIKLSKDMKEIESNAQKDRDKIRLEIKETKSSLLKWSFTFWISQIGVIAGIGFFIYKAINL